MNTYFELLNKVPGSIYNREWTEASKPGIVKLFDLYSAMFDRLKDVVDDIAVLKHLNTQHGKVLDEIGKIVKEPRANRSDDLYRKFLMIAIQRNISNGSIRKVADITKLIIGEAADFTLTEKSPFVLLDSFEPAPAMVLDATWILNPYVQAPATFKLNITGIGPEQLTELEKYLEDAVLEIKAAGVKAEITITA